MIWLWSLVFVTTLLILALLGLMEVRMTNTQADLDTSLTTLIADVAALSAAVTANSAAVAALLAKIAAGGTTDFSAEVNEVTATDQAVKDAVAAIGTADSSAS